MVKVLTSDQQHSIHQAYQVVDVLGLAFVTVVLALMTAGRQFRIARFQYVYILFCCFWLLLVFAVPSNFSPPLGFCFFWTPWLVFFFGASWLWEVSIALNLFRMIVLSKLKKPSFLNHWMIWTLQLFLTAFPAATGFYSRQCSSTSIRRHNWVLLIVRLIPLMICLLLVLVLYAACGYHLCKRSHSMLDSKTKKALIYLSCYPMAFWVCWMPFVINRLYGLATDSVSFPLEMAESLGNELHPIVASLIYLWPTATATWRRLLDSCNRFKQSDPEG